MKRRRRKKRAIRNRWIGLLGVCAVLAILVIVGVEKPKVETKPEEPKTEQPEKKPEEKPNYVLEIPEEEEEVQITISAAGDCTLGTDKNFNRNTSFVAMYNEKKDPSYFLKKVRKFDTQNPRKPYLAYFFAQI